MRRAFLLWSLVIVLTLALGPLRVLAQEDEGPDPRLGLVPGEILVKFRPGTPGQAIAALHRQHGGQVAETIPGIDVQVVRVPPGQEQARAAAYRRNPTVLFAEVNGLYQAVDFPTVTPTDPLYPQQWQYNNTGQTGGTPDADIDAPEAWAVTPGSVTVAIAILDTGIDQSHEDLQAKIKKNVNFTTSKSVDDKYGHGTHVAGSAAAVTNNATGVAGTCPQCALYNVKVLADNGAGSWDWVAKGIVWAADNGAKVINLSLGGSSASRTVEEAVNYAWNKGVVIVAAAGNAGTNALFYPAAYSNVIAVAATDQNDQKPSWSNYGADWVDIAAPGAAILSTAPDHGNRIWGGGVRYGTLSGTSMASPHVAGVAGLVWASGVCGASPTNTCVRSRLETGADPIAGTGTLWARGRLNAYCSVADCSAGRP
jgi:thermitase